MTQKHYTTKKRSFKHLTKEKRAQIEILLKQGMPKIQIAKEIGISRSTLYNELARGTVEQLDTNLSVYKKYFYDVGQRIYENNRKSSRPPLKLMKAYEFIRYAENKMLKEKLSPDTICGRAKEENFKVTVCTKTLYNYIDQGLLKVKNIDLLLRVRRNIKKEQTRKNIKIYGTSIESRPDTINDRTDFGHWEIDTIVGNADTNAAFLTLDERKSRKRHIIKIKSKTSEAVGEGIEKLKSIYGENFAKVFKSVTSDNGSEFARLNEQFPATTAVYYAHPYSAWERGTNEKQNSIVRRFFPKGTNLDTISEKQVSYVENWINNLPRKIFNYSTSDEIFESVLFDIAI